MPWMDAMDIYIYITMCTVKIVDIATIKDVGAPFRSLIFIFCIRLFQVFHEKLMKSCASLEFWLVLHFG